MSSIFVCEEEKTCHKYLYVKKKKHVINIFVCEEEKTCHKYLYVKKKKQVGNNVCQFYSDT